MNRSPLRGYRWALPVLAGSALILAACGGASLATPTPIPADIVQPVQSTPALSLVAPRFNLQTPETSPIFVTPRAETETLPPIPAQSRESLLAAMLMNLPPSAMGIATGGGTILNEPNGDFVASVPAGGTVTVTGRSQNGAWLAVYTSEARTGWMTAGALRLFGDDDLTVVENALSPAPVATMLADAMLPPAQSMANVIATRAAAPPTPEPAATPAASASAQEALQDDVATEDTPASDVSTDNADSANSALIGIVQTQGNLNLRAAPSADSDLVAALPPQSPVIILGRIASSDWLRVRTPAGDGWVDARFVEVQGDMSALQVITP